MFTRTLFLLALLLTLVDSLGPPSLTKQYVVIAPATVRPNNNPPYSFSVTLFENLGYSLPVGFTAELVQIRNASSPPFVLATQVFQQNNFGPQQFTFLYHQNPLVGVSSSNFTLRLTFSQSAVATSQVATSPVPASQEYFGSIQTDKKVYQPGQAVYMTAFVVDRDLKPPSIHNNLTVSVKDSAGNLVGFWPLINQPKALWSGRLVLPPMINQGQWSISLNSTLLPKIVTRKIDVEEYELPRFQVNVVFPDGANWLFKTDDESGYTGQVIANYTFGKPVRGQVEMTLSSTGGCNQNYDNDEYSSNPFSFIIQLYGDGADDEGLFTATGLNDIIGVQSLNQGVCVLTFEVVVTDKVSGTAASSFATVTMQRYLYDLEFVDPLQGRTLAPSTSYSLRLRVIPTRTSQIVDPGSLVKLQTTTLKVGDNYAYCLPNWRGNQGVTKTLTVDRNGYVTNANQMVASDASKIGFKAWMEDPFDGSHVAEACVLFDVKSGNDEANLEITIDNSQQQRQSPPKLGDSVTFKISRNFQGDVYIMLAAINSGQILSTRQLGQNDFFAASGSWQTATVRQSLLSASMAPRVVAVAWSIDPASNRFLSDMVSFKVDGLVKQNVSLTYSDDIALPGDNCPSRPKASKWLNIATLEARSFVAVLAVDKRVRLLPSNQQAAVTNDAVLRMIDRATDDPWADTSCWSCGGWYWYPADSLPAGPTKTPDRLLRLGGLMVLVANASALQPSPIVRTLPDATSPSVSNQLTTAATEVRRNLPEVWFWSLGETDDNGELHLPVTLPDSITTWETTAFAIGSDLGFGAVPSPVELVARKVMFVDLILPQRSVIFGEEFAAVGAVYNYASVDLSISLLLEDISDVEGGAFETSIDGGVVYSQQSASKTVNVPPNSGRSFVVWIRPLQVGSMPMRLTATGTSKSPSRFDTDDSCSSSQSSDYSSGDNPQSNSLYDILEIANFTVEPEGQARFANKAFFVRISPSTSQSLVLNVTERDMLNDVSEASIVYGSKMHEIGLNGDLMGPMLSNFGDVVRMPSGCGEQLLKSMMPNAFVYKYLKSTNQLVEPLKGTLTNFIVNYLPQVMAYQGSDGGFSIFGPKSGYPGNVAESWLTAFICRYLLFCSSFVDNFPTDQSASDRAFAFLATKINPNGSVTEAYPGTTHPEMKGGAWRGDNLAIYVYTTFAEASKFHKITNVFDALRRKVSSVATTSNDPYQLALAAYAASSTAADRRDIAQVAINRLLAKANRTGSGDTEKIFWQPGDPALYLAPMQPPSAVETAGYALLAFLKNGRVEAPAVNRWLVSQRNSLGGFDQTQETVVGLHAMSEFAAGIPNNGQDTNINVTATFYYTSGYRWSNKQPINVNASNSKVFQRINAPYRPDDQLSLVTISTRGSGYLYVQASARYNVIAGSDDEGDVVRADGFRLLVKQNQFRSSSVNSTTKTNKILLQRTRRSVMLDDEDDVLIPRRVTTTRRPLVVAAVTNYFEGRIHTTEGDYVATRPTSRGGATTKQKLTTTTRKATTTTTSVKRTTPSAPVVLISDKSEQAENGIGDDVSIKVCINNATADAKHGMVTMEVHLASGFVADLEKTKRLNSLRSEQNTTGDTVSLQQDSSVEVLHDPRLQQIELGPKTIVYYFDLGIPQAAGGSSNKSAETSCCVIASMYRHAQVRKTKSPYISVYNYYRPAMNKQVSYKFTNMAMMVVPPAATTKKMATTRSIKGLVIQTA